VRTLWPLADIRSVAKSDPASKPEIFGNGHCIAHAHEEFYPIVSKQDYFSLRNFLMTWQSSSWKIVKKVARRLHNFRHRIAFSPPISLRITAAHHELPATKQKRDKARAEILQKHILCGRGIQRDY
jgi:hypothetical protein